jgi:4-amino-4-deoxy-L-arabinose transferase-like glycosyltransferase
MRIQEAIPARRPLIFILPVLIAAVWLFGHGLRSFPLRPFDEARLAISAAEMSLYGDWLVTRHDGSRTFGTSSRRL